MKDTKGKKDMKSCLNKILGIFITIAILFGISSNVFAASSDRTLKVVKQSSGQQTFGDDQGFMSKDIVDYDADTGEVTVELKVSNTKKPGEEIEYNESEIYIMVSENVALESTTLNRCISNIENLVKKILAVSQKTKVGIIGIKGTVYDGTEDEDGNMIWGPKDEGGVQGRDSDAEIVINPTGDLNAIKSALSNMNPTKTEYRPNLQASIRLARNSYTSNKNKVLISVYDDVPTIAIGVESQTSYGGSSEYATIEDAVTSKHDKIATNTRDEILALEGSNISLLLLRPGNTSYDEVWYDAVTGDKLLDFDGSPYVNKLYGTIENPTYGKMYLFNNQNIDTIITENIYQDVKKIIPTDMNNVVVTDYFPAEILDNFDFSFVGNPSHGNVTPLNTSSRSFTWNIGTLEGEEVATLRYKLKLKASVDSSILGEILPTNESLDLTYSDGDGTRRFNIIK